MDRRPQPSATAECSAIESAGPLVRIVRRVPELSGGDDGRICGRRKDSIA
jgi:hypothetical protein